MRLLLVLAASGLLFICSCLPLPRQQDIPIPDAQPDQVLVPSGPTPSPLPPPPITLPPPPPATTIAPPTTAPPPTAATAASTPTPAPPQPPPPTTPSGPDGAGVGDGAGDADGGDADDADAEPTPAAGALVGADLDGLSQRWRAGLIGGLIGGLFALLLLIVCVLLLALRRREPQQPTGEYSAAQAGVDASGTEVVADAATYQRDDVRDIGPAEPPAAAHELPAAAAAAALPAAAAASSSDEGGSAGGADVKRGPTPPPHDYVLGAGPAASRTDFIDLRTRFERDEIGDNSAVLGVERGGARGAERDAAAAAREAEASAASAASASAAEGGGAPGGEDAGRAADREGDTVGMTFESQERLMAGGDGSGAVSDAPQASGPGSIAEESGDMPSLERDPIQRDGGAY